MNSPLLPLTATGIVIAAVVAYVRRRNTSIASLPGPAQGHWLLGHQPTIQRSAAGEMDFDLKEKYGGAVKLDGAFGERLLWICDPKAVQYVAQGGGYRFIRASERKEQSRLILGASVLNAEGDTHRRMRRIMLPGFGTNESKTYVPSFARKAAKMGDKWVESMHDQEGAIINVPFWSGRATLDALGESAFDYHFNALDDMSNELSKVFSNFFAKTRFMPSNWEILLQEAVALLPVKLIQMWNEYIPDKKRAIMIGARSVCERTAHHLISEKSSALLSDKTGNDIMSLLVKANASAGAKGQLNDQEMLGQLTTIILAGHETTATTLAWALLELARNPGAQKRLREEIRTIRRERDEPELSAETFEGMPYLDAVVKETLRFHGVVPQIAKEAAVDDVVPLHRPVVGADGEMIQEVPVQKGQKILLSIAAYNRDKDTFGQDADQYNPDRWLEDGHITKQASVGVYANLFTFGGGHRACLGWRFAVLELSAFLFELVDRFEFDVDPNLKVYRAFSGVMQPMLEGELKMGTQLPLRVRIASSSE
ncbi:cytochrome P450 [Schizophyllum commune H4-8]|uniref:Cytochrome P450 n=1 Tax=Schizophyllum commune (strain H4-8 / FGSC 9210) TaxID=578458 RepID=D8PUL3_SCHCM|nr:cytochrome P450 [Schizophyllum commune H4-8]KAI5899074.1 cytochrome P450 [Schizophyllum commune H4-8]